MFEALGSCLSDGIHVAVHNSKKPAMVTPPLLKTSDAISIVLGADGLVPVIRFDDSIKRGDSSIG